MFLDDRHAFSAVRLRLDGAGVKFFCGLVRRSYKFGVVAKSRNDDFSEPFNDNSERFGAVSDNLNDTRKYAYVINSVGRRRRFVDVFLTA